jgi:hypothetical protein
MPNLEEVEPITKKTYTDAQKRAIYTWQSKNREKIKQWRINNKDIFKINNERYINKNKDSLKEKWRLYSQKRYESRILTNNSISS